MSLRCVLTALLACLARPSAADPWTPVLAADLAAALAPSDMVWAWQGNGKTYPNGTRLRDPLTPLKWYHNAYIGNGLVGAAVTAVLAGDNIATRGLRIDIGRTDVWACNNRQSVGHLVLTPASGATINNVAMRISLLNASLTVNISTAVGTLQLTLLVNAADPTGPTGVLLLGASATGGEQLPPKLAWNNDLGTCANNSVQTGSVAQTPWGAPINWWAQWPPGGGTFSVALTQLSPATFILSCTNTQRTAAPTNSTQQALAAMYATASAGAGTVAAAHTAWWLAFWQKSFFSFGDAAGCDSRIEQFSHINLYRYASAARHSMSDLMGPWGPGNGATQCIGPWCQFVWDMNQQVMLYLPTLSGHGDELAVPSLAMFASFLDGSWGAKYGSNAPPQAVDTLWWLGNMQRYIVNHAGPQADAFIAPLYQGLRLGLMPPHTPVRNGSDHLLHAYGCDSPEYTQPCPGGSCTDCTYTLSITKWAAATALAVARQYYTNDTAAIAQYSDILARLAPFPIDPATGSWEVAQGLPFAVPHRHYSHLLGLYDLATESDVATMEAGLDVWWRVTCKGPQAAGGPVDGDGDCRGFTQAAMGAMSGYLNRTAAAVGNLTSYLDLEGLPNAMYGEMIFAGHPDEFAMVAESAYSLAATTHRLLLGSGYFPPIARGVSMDYSAGALPPQPLRLFPAAPWANVSLFRARAEGALLVSAVRLNGVTQWAVVEADDGGGHRTGQAVAFYLSSPDWAAQGVARLAVTGPPGVAAAPVPGQPGNFLVTGMTRGQGAAFYDASIVPAPTVFAVGIAGGRNATQDNNYGFRWDFPGSRIT